MVLQGRERQRLDWVLQEGSCRDFENCNNVVAEHNSYFRIIFKQHSNYHPDSKPGILIFQVASFDTVEDFWGLYNFILPPTKLAMKCEYSIFKVWSVNTQSSRYLNHLKCFCLCLRVVQPIVYRLEFPQFFKYCNVFYKTHERLNWEYPLFAGRHPAYVGRSP